MNCPQMLYTGIYEAQGHDQIQIWDQLYLEESPEGLAVRSGSLCSSHPQGQNSAKRIVKNPTSFCTRKAPYSETVPRGGIRCVSPFQSREPSPPVSLTTVTESGSQVTRMIPSPVGTAPLTGWPGGQGITSNRAYPGAVGRTPRKYRVSSITGPAAQAWHRLFP